MSKAHLEGKAGADAVDGVVEVHAAVDGHDVGAAGRHALQQAAAAADVQDDGQVRVRLLHAVDDLLDVGARKHVKVLRREVRRPGVEDLHRLRAAVCLRVARCMSRQQQHTARRVGMLEDAAVHVRTATV